MNAVFIEYSKVETFWGRLKSSIIAFSSRLIVLFCVTAILTLLPIQSASATHTIKQIAPGLTLEVYENETINDGKSDPLIINVAHLRVSGETKNEQISTNITMTCLPGEKYSVTLVFLKGDVRRLFEQSSTFIFDEPAQITFRINEASSFSESWYYGGVFNEQLMMYGVGVMPMPEIDMSGELYRKSSDFIKTILSADKLNLKITLDNGLEVEGSFDLSIVNEGFAELSGACKKIPRSERS